MHKSGTTLVSQMLHYSGINMGDFDGGTSYDKGNKYERQSCLQLNMDILGTQDYRVLHLTSGPDVLLSLSQRERMQEIIRECESGDSDWGFKDPRCCLTYELWAEELPEHKIIVVYRNPEQIWPRFKWQGKQKYHTNFNRAYEFLKRWHEHNFEIINCLDRTDREVLVLNYHDLMTSYEGFDRLERFVGHKLEDRRRLDLYRSRHSGDLFLNVSDRLLGYQRGRSITGTMARLDKWAKRDPGEIIK